MSNLTAKKLARILDHANKDWILEQYTPMQVRKAIAESLVLFFTKLKELPNANSGAQASHCSISEETNENNS